MNSKALTLGVVSVVLGVGTYFVLNKIAPQGQAEEARAQTGPTVDEVFNGQVNVEAVNEVATAAVPPDAATEATETAATPGAGAYDDSEADLPAEEPEPAALAGAAEEPEPAVLGGSAEEPEAPALTQTAQAGDWEDEPEPATLPPRSESTRTASPRTDPAPLASPTTAPTVSRVEAPFDTAATSAPGSASTPAPAPASTADVAPSPEAASSSFQASRDTTPEAPTVAEKPKAPARKLPKKVELAQAWWGPVSADTLSITYAGSASFRKAIVLMFNGDFSNAESATEHVQVLNKSGKPVQGSWEVNPKNPRMLLFPVTKSGEYRVVVGSGVQDSRNRSLGRSVEGPVHVK